MKEIKCPFKIWLPERFNQNINVPRGPEETRHLGFVCNCYRENPINLLLMETGVYPVHPIYGLSFDLAKYIYVSLYFLCPGSYYSFTFFI